jgi:hypothetical protein
MKYCQQAFPILDCSDLNPCDYHIFETYEPIWVEGDRCGT